MQPHLSRRAALFRTLCCGGAAVLAVLIVGTTVLDIHEVQIVPTLCYLLALWFLGQAFGQIAEGRGFRPVTMRALRRSGAALMVGGAYATLAVPSLKYFVFEMDQDKFFDLPALVIALVGGALIMLAGLLAGAGSLEAELEEIV